MNREQCIEILQDIIRINTVNGNEHELALYLKNLLKAHDIDSQLVEYSKGRSNLVAEISNGEGKNLGLSGHMDVVSEGKENEWIHPPFLAHIQNDVLWGRGSSDMKAGLAALVIAMIHLNESKKYHGKIRLLATVGEEVGELGARQLTELGFVDDLDGMLIAEPWNYGIVYAHMGSLNYRVVSKGISAHSSRPELGNNAIENMMTAMLRISEKVSDMSKKYQNSLMGRTFQNITLVNGGLQVNSIPDQAEFESNVRTIPEFDNDAVIQTIQEVIDDLHHEKRYDLTFEITASQPPVQSRSDSELIKCVSDIANKNSVLNANNLFRQMRSVLKETGEVFETDEFDQISKIEPIIAYATTDAAQFMKGNNKMDLAIYGPGMPTLIHKTNERVSVSQYLAFIEVYEKIILKYLR